MYLLYFPLVQWKGSTVMAGGEQEEELTGKHTNHIASFDAHQCTLRHPQHTPGAVNRQKQQSWYRGQDGLINKLTQSF